MEAQAASLAEKQGNREREKEREKGGKKRGCEPILRVLLEASWQHLGGINSDVY